MYSQVPEAKPAEELRAECESVCAACAKPWDQYRGKYVCGGVLPKPVGWCKVPVLVCDACQRHPTFDAKDLRCPLCAEGYVPPQVAPDFDTLKRARAVGGGEGDGDDGDAAAGGRAGGKRKRSQTLPSSPSVRLFVGGLPFVVDRPALCAALSPGAEERVSAVRWLTDHKSGLFYGSAFVRMASLAAAQAAVDAAAGPGIKLGGRALRVRFAPPHEGGELWPTSWAEAERPSSVKLEP